MNHEPFILEYTNWKQVKNTRYDAAVLPWGATEPHNYHLPYGTDSLETKAIAHDAARKAWDKGAHMMILPSIPLGMQNPGQVEIPFCLHTRLNTQFMILEDILNSLYLQGIRRFVLMNGHGGNDFKPLIRELQLKFPDMLITLLEWFRLLPNDLFFEEEGDHAGEMETSVILHYFPELVLPLEEAGSGYAKNPKLRSISNKIAWTPRRWNKVTEDTGVGNPSKATARKGEQFTEKITGMIADFFVELSTVNPEDLYD